MFFKPRGWSCYIFDAKPIEVDRGPSPEGTTQCHDVPTASSFRDIDVEMYT